METIKFVQQSDSKHGEGQLSSSLLPEPIESMLTLRKYNNNNNSNNLFLLANRNPSECEIANHEPKYFCESAEREAETITNRVSLLC